MIFPCFCRIRPVRAILRTNSTPRRPRVPPLGLVAGAVLGARWAGSSGLALWPSLGWDPSSRRDRLWRRWPGRGLGAATGGIAGGLIGLGIPEYEAKRYEGKVKDGNILMSVHTQDSRERDRAKEIFTNAGAEDISYTGEEGVPKEDRAAARPLKA